MRRCAFIAVALCVLASGCSLFKTEAEVTSDTSWSGSFNGATVDGTGNKKISLGGGNGPKCVVVQKQTRQGFLTVSITGGGETKTTTAEFGVVSACSSSTP